MNCASLSSVETEVILWPRSFKNCTVDSLVGPKVSKAIGWNTYDPDYYYYYYYYYYYLFLVPSVYPEG